MRADSAVRAPIAAGVAGVVVAAAAILTGGVATKLMIAANKNGNIMVFIDYLVPKILSPASPSPGTMYALSSSFSSMQAT